MKTVEINGRKVANLTPHTVTVVVGDDKRIEIPPSGRVARVRQEERPAGMLGDIPLISVHYGNVEGLPEGGVDAVIVSTLVAQAIRSSNLTLPYLVLVPNTGPSAIRDEKGNIIGVKSLILY